MIIIPEHIIFEEIENLIKYVWTNYKAWKGIGSVKDPQEAATGFTITTTTEGSLGTAEVNEIDTVADVGGSLNGEGFTMSTPSSDWLFWFDTTTEGVLETPNSVGVRVAIDEDDDADTIATKLAAAFNRYPLWWTATVAANKVTVTCVESDARRRSVLFSFFGNRTFGKYKYFDKMAKMLENKYNARKGGLHIQIGFNPQQKNLPAVSILLPSEEAAPKRAATATGVHSSRRSSGNAIDKSVEQGQMYQSTYDLMVTSNNENDVIVIYNFLKTLFLSGISQFQHSGLQNLSISGRDVVLDFDIDPMTMYNRGIGLSFFYDNQVPELQEWTMPDTLNFNGTPVTVVTDVSGTNIGLVRNSIGTLLATVIGGTAVVLDDISFTDSDGNVIPTPVGVDIVATPCVGGGGGSCLEVTEVLSSDIAPNNGDTITLTATVINGVADTFFWVAHEPLSKLTVYIGETALPTIDWTVSDVGGGALPTETFEIWCMASIGADSTNENAAHNRGGLKIEVT